MTPQTILAALITCGLLVVVNSQACEVGTSQLTEQPSAFTGFLLDASNPVNCTAVLTTLQYCHHGNEANGALEIAFYEKTSNSERMFNRTTESVEIELQPSSSGCNIVSVNLPVRPGYILGACVPAPLTVVGNDSNSNSFLLTMPLSQCSNGLPSVTEGTFVETPGIVLQVLVTGQSGLTAGEAAAIVIPILLLLIILALITCLCWKYKWRQNAKSSEEEKLMADSRAFDNVNYVSVHSLYQRASSPSMGDSGNYEPMGNYRSADVSDIPLFYTPPPSGESDNTDATLVDSGSYAQVREPSVPRLRPSQRGRREIEESVGQRPVYELQSGRSRGLSLECSYDDIVHKPQASRQSSVEYQVADSTNVTITDLLEMNKEEDIYSQVNPYQRPAGQVQDLLTQLNTWGVATIPNASVETQASIGMGQFGTVNQGVWNGSGSDKPVALKSLKNDSTLQHQVLFLQEAATMAQFRHPNITMIYGVIIDTKPMVLVVELASKGDLRNHLITLRCVEGPAVAELSNALLRYSQHVALGMQYLAAKGFVHRDLAARNILVSKRDICKVADFGMSRDLADEAYYVSQGGKVPVKWTAPEALHYKKYSTASDVWSYGCLLYEIWSLGHKPFEGIGNIEAVRKIDSGKRLPPPPGCPKHLYNLMMLCWHPVSGERPGFREVVLRLVEGEEEVLSIPSEDCSTHPLASQLGAALSAGEAMYLQLQSRYISDST